MPSAELNPLQQLASRLNETAANYLKSDRAQDVALRARLGGTLVGAGVGAGVGALGGLFAPLGFSKKKRMLGGALAGAGLGGAVGYGPIADVFRSNDLGDALRNAGLPAVGLNVKNVGTTEGAKQIEKAIESDASYKKFKDRLNLALSVVSPLTLFARD